MPFLQMIPLVLLANLLHQMPVNGAGQCTEADCSGHGVCFGPREQPICFCHHGFVGMRCEHRSASSASDRLPRAFLPKSEPSATSPSGCSPAHCQDRGICVAFGSDQQSRLCLCQLGFNGLRCENDLFRRTVDLLQKEGLFGGNQSSTAEGTIGPNGTALCSPSDCHDQGICLGLRSKPRCVCNLGFGGPRCESALVPSMCASKAGDHCSGRGICLGTELWHTCACQPGWAGRSCEEPATASRLRIHRARLHSALNRQVEMMRKP